MNTVFHGIGIPIKRIRRSWDRIIFIVRQRLNTETGHDDVIKWKHFPRYWPFVRGIHRSLMNSPHKGQWHGTLIFSLICVWINDWVNNRGAGYLRRYSTHYGVIVMGLARFVYGCFYLSISVSINLIPLPCYLFCVTWPLCVSNHRQLDFLFTSFPD